MNFIFFLIILKKENPMRTSPKVLISQGFKYFFDVAILPKN